MAFFEMGWEGYADVGVGRHVDVLLKNPRVDVERVRNITYLHEFDRWD